MNGIPVETHVAEAIRHRGLTALNDGDDPNRGG